MGLADIHPSPVFNYSPLILYTFLALVAAFKATGLTLIWYICKPLKALRIVVAVLLSLYTFLCLVNFACDRFYGFGITHKFITLIVQTNPREAGEFMPILGNNLLSTLTSWQLWLSLSAVATATFIARFIKPTVFGIVAGVLSLGGIAFITYTFSTITTGRTALVMGLRVTRQVTITINELREVEALMAARRTLPDSDKVFCEHTTPTIIMVVGESASRGHHSLYGYGLQTTPELENMMDSLYIFTDAIGCSPRTAGNIERILSFKPDTSVTEGDWMRYPLVIDLFNAADYTTSWLSNQEKNGDTLNGSYPMVSHAHRISYVGAESSYDVGMLRYDDALLPDFYKALSDTAINRFIGLHLLGSHFLYHMRYPKERAIFDKTDIMRTVARPWFDNEMATLAAHYDNSIAFTDSILGQIIQAVAQRPEPALLIYFSDHGENVHDTKDFVWCRDDRFVEVPFIIYANSAFRTANPDLTERIKAARDLPISTSNIIHSLMTLAGISYPAYNPALDFLSPQFRPRPRYVDGEVWRYEHVGKQ